MSSAPLSTQAARKSFAQVAAAANSSKAVQNVTTSKSTHTGPGQSALPQSSRHGPSTIPNILGASSQQSNSTPGLVDMMQATSLADTNTGPRLAEDVQARPVSDFRSTASRASGTLDEKESLRPEDSASVQAGADKDSVQPDDSASMQAGQDEGTSSPRESVDPSWKPGLETVSKTLSEELLEVPQSNHAQLPHEANGLYLDSSLSRGQSPLLVDQAVGGSVPKEILRNPNVASTSPPGSNSFSPSPDTKLLEALKSDKDRLFVLKIQQDLRDFIKDSKERELQLPQTNAFYRMLSHKLAEYYLLGHILDPSSSSVRIYRTLESRLQPPLGKPETTSEGPTPPPSSSARKIIRRGEGGDELVTQFGASESRPTSNSAFAASSGAPSEADAPRDKSVLSREEREKQYNEARARIFGASEMKSSEAQYNADSPDKGISRSSSNSGNKKTKRRKPRDDSFEARSAYMQYGSQPYFVPDPAPSAPEASQYYVMQPYPYQPTNSSFNPGYNGNAGMHDAVAQGGAWQTQSMWPSGIQDNSWRSSSGGLGMTGSGYYQAADSFHSYGPSNVAAQSTPRAQPSHPVYYSGYNQQPNEWHTPYQSPQSSVVPVDNSHYFNTGGYSPQNFNGGSTPSTPAHGGQSFNVFNPASFNPQSQSFVPRGQGAPGLFNPRASGGGNGLPLSYMSQPPTHRFSQSPGLAAPPAHGPAGYHSMYPPQGTANQTRHQNHNSQQSSISKWPAPASLPAKPPPTASSLSFQNPLHSESRKASLPPYPLAATSGRN